MRGVSPLTNVKFGILEGFLTIFREQFFFVLSSFFAEVIGLAHFIRNLLDML